jgi:hypothetical protein
MSLQRRGFFQVHPRHRRCPGRPRRLSPRPRSQRTPRRPTPVQGRIGRRIVTGVDAQGKSKISDTPVRPVEGRNTVVWAVRQMPAALDGPIEPTPDFRWNRVSPAEPCVFAGVAFDAPRTRMPA